MISKYKNYKKKYILLAIKSLHGQYTRTYGQRRSLFVDEFNRFYNIKQGGYNTSSMNSTHGGIFKYV